MRNANKEITKKHDHSLTNLLKGALFSLVMLAPIFSIAVRCGYVMFNKNAYESYSGENQLQLKHADSIFDINANQYGNVIRFDSVNADQTMTGTYVYYNYLEYLGGNLPQNIVSTLENTSELYVYFSGTRLVRVQDSNNTHYVNLSQYNFQFKVNELTTIYDNVSQYIYYYEESEYFTLDNAFSYGISNLKNEAVFNWTQNTALYQPINAMCTGLGITEEAIAIMLTYWSLMTAIYIIFNIVIVLFTKLTHLLN